MHLLSCGWMRSRDRSLSGGQYVLKILYCFSFIMMLTPLISAWLLVLTVSSCAGIVFHKDGNNDDDSNNNSNNDDDDNDDGDSSSSVCRRRNESRSRISRRRRQKRKRRRITTAITTTTTTSITTTTTNYYNNNESGHKKWFTSISLFTHCDNWMRKSLTVDFVTCTYTNTINHGGDSDHSNGGGGGCFWRRGW